MKPILATVFMLACFGPRGSAFENERTQGTPRLKVDSSKFIAAGLVAEKEGRWGDAIILFSAYLSRDSTSPIAHKVREELKNIQWRVQYLAGPEAGQLDEQKKDEAAVQDMMVKGLVAEAAQKVIDMIGKRPNHWRTYFLAATVFEQMGNYESALSIMEMGVPYMDEAQRELAGQMYAHLVKAEKQIKELKEAEELLKSSKPAEAATVYRHLAKESPHKPLYRQLAIHALVLAERYTEALALINETPLPNGISMRQDVRDKLVAEITALKKQYLALQQAPKQSNAGKPSQASSAKKSPPSSSMSKDFLNRIKK